MAINLVVIEVNAGRETFVKKPNDLTMDEQANRTAEKLACADRLRADLTSRLSTMIESYEGAENALQALDRCIDRGADLVRPESALHQVFGRWLDDAIRSFEAAGQGIGCAKIERRELDSECTEIDRTQQIYPSIGQPADRLTLRGAAENLLNDYNFDRLVEGLDRLSGKLEAKGLQEAADKLANDLGLNADYGREHPPKRTARHWSFSRSLFSDGWGGYGYQTREDLMKLRDSFKVAGEDAGVPGLGHAMQTIATAIDAATERLPSRTKLGVGTPIEAVVYKEKLELKMSHEIGNALLAFIVSHTTRNLVDLKASVVGSNRRLTL